jgi:hypothetical protein
MPRQFPRQSGRGAEIFTHETHTFAVTTTTCIGGFEAAWNLPYLPKVR